MPDTTFFTATTTRAWLPRLGFFGHFSDRHAMKAGHPVRTLVVPISYPNITLPIDWTKDNSLAFPADGNNTCGDCAYAAACHGDNTFTGNVGLESVFDTSTIIADYLQLSGGDNGLNDGQIIGAWKLGLANVPAAAINDAISIDPNDATAMQAAIFLFGGVFFTLSLPDQWKNGFQSGDIWSAPATPDPKLGHAIWLNGVDVNGNYKFQSWGEFGWITPAGIASCDPGAFVVFSPRWFDSGGIAPNGLSYDQLATLWAQFGGTPLPYQNRVFEGATTFGNENDGVWTMAYYGGDIIHPNLIFIKTSNTPSGNVEVHVASCKSNYQTRIFEGVSTFGVESDGVWLMADYDKDGTPDLVFIKTSNTPSGNVEVHIASGSSNYQTRIFEGATTFGNETDGTWTMVDYDGDGVPDLVFIKTSNTPSGRVEVHVASASSNYKTRIFEGVTTFGNENDGTWLMANFAGSGVPDLIFIKTSNTTVGQVEVHVASGASNYQTRIFESPTTFYNENDGAWLMSTYSATRPTSLTFIKTSNTPSGNVEVHVANH